MTKVAIRVYKGTAKCGLVDIPNMMLEHFGEIPSGVMEFSVVPVEGGEVAIVTDLSVDYSGKFEEMITQLGPADGLVEKLKDKFPNIVQEEDEYATPEEREEGNKILQAYGVPTNSMEADEESDEDYDYSLALVFEIPPKELAKIKWT